MIVTKQLADFLTWARATLVFVLPLIGLVQGAEALITAVILMVLNWTVDSLDGPLARRSRVQYRTWIGNHDLEIDMLISCGMLGYLLAAGFISWQVTLIYLLFWLLIFWRVGLVRALGALFQAPIYGLLIYISIQTSSETALILIGWIALAIIITWPKFPKVIVPDFLQGMRQILTKSRHQAK